MLKWRKGYLWMCMPLHAFPIRRIRVHGHAAHRHKYIADRVVVTETVVVHDLHCDRYVLETLDRVTCKGDLCIGNIVKEGGQDKGWQRTSL